MLRSIREAGVPPTDHARRVLMLAVESMGIGGLMGAAAMRQQVLAEAEQKPALGSGTVVI